MPVGMSGGRSPAVPCFSPCAYLTPASDPSADGHRATRCHRRSPRASSTRGLIDQSEAYNTRAGFSLAHFRWDFDHLPVLALRGKVHALAPRREIS